MVWEAAPKVIVASVTLRVLTALLPLAVLKVTQVIIDDVYNLTARHQSLPSYFWWLVALEFGLASLAAGARGYTASRHTLNAARSGARIR